MQQLSTRAEVPACGPELVSNAATVQEIGRLLRRARQEHGLELEKLATSLLMQIDHLRALEEGRLDRFSSLFCAVASLRTYANRLGLDGTKLAEPLEHTLHAITMLPASGQATGSRRCYRNALAAAVVLLAAVGSGRVVLWLAPDPAAPVHPAIRLASATGESSRQAPDVDRKAAPTVAPVEASTRIITATTAGGLTAAPSKLRAEVGIQEAFPADMAPSDARSLYMRSPIDSAPSHDLSGLTGADRIVLGMIVPAGEASDDQKLTAKLPGPTAAPDHTGRVIALAEERKSERTLSTAEPRMSRSLAPDNGAGQVEPSSRTEPTTPEARNAKASQEEPRPAYGTGHLLEVASPSPSVELDGNAIASAQRSPVPLPTLVPAERPAAQPATAANRGEYAIQLAAVRSSSAAVAAWPLLVKRYPMLANFTPRDPEIVDIPGRGIFHRVQGGAFSSRANAQAMCDRLRAEGADCLVVVPEARSIKGSADRRLGAGSPP